MEPDLISEENLYSLGLLDSRLEIISQMRKQNAEAAKLMDALETLEEQQQILVGLLSTVQSQPEDSVSEIHLSSAWIERKLEEVGDEIANLHAYISGNSDLIPETNQDYFLAQQLQEEYNRNNQIKIPRKYIQPGIPVPTIPFKKEIPTRSFKSAICFGERSRCPASFSGIDQPFPLNYLDPTPLSSSLSIKDLLKLYPNETELANKLWNWIALQPTENASTLIQTMTTFLIKGDFPPKLTLLIIEICRGLISSRSDCKSLRSLLLKSNFSEIRKEGIKLESILKILPNNLLDFPFGFLCLSEELIHQALFKPEGYSELCVDQLPEEVQTWIKKFNPQL